LTIHVGVVTICTYQAEPLHSGDKMSELQYVNEDDFQAEVLESNQPVLVDFTAVWCGPCKMLEPVVVELASEWAGKVKVVKLDVDHNANIAMQYQVMGVPTLMLFSQGEIKERLTGYKPKKQIVSKLTPHI
jgi:thioredoxin 1